MNRTKDGLSRKRAVSMVINLLLFLFTVYGVSLFFYRGGDGNMQVFGSRCFRFFTVDSNILAALAGIILFVFEVRTLRTGDMLPRWAVVLKMVATVAVAVTFFTVMLFLGPVFGFRGMFAGANFFMHLVSPLLAMISLCVLENREPLRFRATFLGLLPTFIYGIVYVYEVFFSRGWPDYYGFGFLGHWTIVAAVMLIATYILCILLWGLRKALGKERAKVSA